MLSVVVLSVVVLSVVVVFSRPSAGKSYAASTKFPPPQTCRPAARCEAKAAARSGTCTRCNHMRLPLLLALLAAKVSGACISMLAAAAIAGGKHHSAPDDQWRCPRGAELCRFNFPADDPRGEKGGYYGVEIRNAPPASKERALGFYSGGSRAHTRSNPSPPPYHSPTTMLSSVRWQSLLALLERDRAGDKEGGCSCVARCGKEEAQQVAC